MRWRAISTPLGRRLVIPVKAPPEEAYVRSRRHRAEQRSLIPGGPVLVSGSDRPAWREPLPAQDHARQTCDSEFRMRTTKPDHRCPNARDLHRIAGQKRVLSGRSVQVHCTSSPKSSPRRSRLRNQRRRPSKTLKTLPSDLKVLPGTRMSCRLQQANARARANFARLTGITGI